MLPADAAELDSWITALVEEGAIREFIYVVMAALASNRPVDARHLVKGTSLLAAVGQLSEVAMRLTGDVPAYLLQSLHDTNLDAQSRSMVLLIVAVWCRERRNGVYPPELFSLTREVSRVPGITGPTKGFLISVAMYMGDQGLSELLRQLHYPNASEHNWKTARERAMSLSDYVSTSAAKPVLDLIPEKGGRMKAAVLPP